MPHAHIVWNPAGGWDVIRPGEAEPLGHYRNRLEAVNSARASLDHQGGGLIVVHSRHAGHQQSGIDAA